MKFKKEIIYDKETIIEGEKAYILKKHRQDFFLSPITLIVMIAWVVYSGKNNMFDGVLLCISATYFLVTFWFYLINPYRSASHWLKVGLKYATWIFTDHGIETITETGAISQDWNQVQSLLVTQNFWFLIYKSGAYSSLPMSSFNYEEKLYIQSKLTAFGAKIM